MEDDSVVPRVYPQFSTPGNIQLYEKERTLFGILTVFAVLFWAALTLATVGLIWLAMPVLYLLAVAGMSYFISYVRGNGVRIGAEQFPELNARLNACCAHVGMRQRPHFYLLTGNGVLNAFATRFLRHYYVVLLSDIVDALQDDEDALNFYIGHELGHISQKHLAHHWWIGIVMLTPLLGSAYSRAREYTCDQYGLACCHNPASAMHALAVLAAGGKRWKTMNMNAYIAQSEQSGGFWMSLNELTGDYPWLCKRIARVQRGDQAVFPRRHWLAWIFAAITPRTGFGLIGGLVIYSYALAILFAVAMPAYKTYEEKKKNAGVAAALSSGYGVAQIAARNVGQFVGKHDRFPTSVRQAGFDPALYGVVQAIDIAPGGLLTVRMAAPLKGMELYLAPLAQDGELAWECGASEQIAADLLPAPCRPRDVVAGDTARPPAGAR